eukprot:1534705-Prymnesium_polylepis.1
MASASSVLISSSRSSLAFTCPPRVTCREPHALRDSSRGSRRAAVPAGLVGRASRRRTLPCWSALSSTPDAFFSSSSSICRSFFLRPLTFLPTSISPSDSHLATSASMSSLAAI